MEQVLTATFEDGVLKPDAPLTLPPRTRVRLTLQALPGPALTDELSWDRLEELWNEVTIDSGGVRPTRDQLHERR
jgi:predicted DNA-binding antitoxin AbrB/MazE fold protein